MLKHDGTQTIETKRLVLRKFAYTDSDDMLKYWISDPLIQSMYCEPTYTNKQEVSELLTKYISSYEKPDYYRWAITLKETKECIGQVSFFLVDNKNHFGELEYCIGSKFQNKGLATEAAEAVIKFGFKGINFHKIQICHKEDNIASKKVIEKCGFKYEGTLRDFFYTDGNYVDRLYYSLLETEW
jgi:ribosomal-protein-alanine N-acetyltransferase